MLGDKLEYIQLDTVLAGDEPAGEYVKSGGVSTYRAHSALGRATTIAECHANRQWTRLNRRDDEQSCDNQRASAARAKEQATRALCPTHCETPPYDRSPV